MSARLLFSGEGFQRGVQVLIELEVAVAKVVFCIWFHIKKVGIFQPGFQPSSNEVLWQNSSPPHATLPARVATLLSTTSCFCRKPARLEIQMKTNIWSDPILSKDFVEPKGKGEEDFSLCGRYPPKPLQCVLLANGGGWSLTKVANNLYFANHLYFIGKQRGRESVKGCQPSIS